MELPNCQHILKNIKRYIPLNPEEEIAFCSIIKTKNIRKRQYLVQPDFVCHHQTYVLKGTLRSYFVSDEGIEHTIQFAIEDWFISDFYSYIHQTPASLFVEALENTTVQQISYEDVENLCQSHPIFERYFRLVAQKSFAYAQKRVLSNLGDSAEKRYLDFIDLYPNIATRVPQYALASYLGMSAEFLSKIKKKLAQQS